MQPHEPEDRFGQIMSKFLKGAKEKFKRLQEQHDEMEKAYRSLADYASFNPNQYKMDECLKDLKTFKDQFIGAQRENAKLRELEEKMRRVTIERERRELEKQNKSQHKMTLNELNGDDEKGLMDKLMNRLETGAAFGIRTRVGIMRAVELFASTYLLPSTEPINSNLAIKLYDS